jgi:ABC-type uncharacterized transport system involved in gliding motility auxiliary subunit
VNAENINPRLSISNKISELFYLYGGRLILNKDLMAEKNLRMRPLFTSSDYSWTRQSFGYGGVNEAPPTPEEILRREPLAALIEGRFPPKYVNQDIPAWPAEPGEDAEDEEALASEITGDAEESKMIVIGCSNMFKDDVLQPALSHRALLLNCVDAMTLGDELINIRSKNIAARRIRQTSTVGKALSKILVVWFSPVVFVAVGIFLTVRRRRR